MGLLGEKEKEGVTGTGGMIMVVTGHFYLDLPGPSGMYGTC